MNVDHLIAVADAYINDLEGSELVRCLKQLSQAINDLASDANEENQRQFLTRRQDLRVLFETFQPFKFRRT
jgi:hypothetical protein